MYIAKYDSDCYQYEKSLDMYKSLKKIENINDFLNYGNFFQSRNV